MTLEEMAGRIDRIESTDAIRQLAYGYALAVDARDLDAIVALYVDDVRVGGGRSGRDALRATFDASLRQFAASAHHVTNHLIEFLGMDDATGLVSCRVEHEVGDKWVTASLVYHDRYVRRSGPWLFRGRVQTRLYATAHDDPPIGPDRLRWPGADAADSGFHETLPAWRAFWDDKPLAERVGEATDGLVTRLRGGTKLPSPPAYLFTKDRDA
jgi:ketosteroid isomerase-like protein